MALILEKKHKKIIDSFLLQYPYQFCAYGSRVKDSVSEYSDLDLCLMSKVSGDMFAHLKYGLSQLLLPFTIDLIAWQYISDEFKQAIQKDLLPYTPDLFLGAQLVDLTHTLSPTIPTWEGTCGLQTIHTSDYDNTFRVQKITLHAGLGTHLDFPAHVVSGGIDASQVSFRDLQAPCAVIYANAEDDADFVLTKHDIEAFEKTHGPIRPDSWLLVFFGWGKRWPDQARYRNADATGMMHFPKIDSDAAQLLVDRQIVGIGVDTLSPDGGNERAQILHQELLPNNILILENLKFEEGLPAQGGHLLISHLPLEGGTESPARVAFCYQL